MGGFIRSFLVFLIMCVSADLFPQVRLHKKNQFDSDGKKHGYWIETLKSDPGKKSFKGWYNHGKETGRCIYYNNGVKLSKFRYVNDSLMHIKRFYPDGHTEYKGSALWLTNKNEMRFCWDGEFVFYDQHHHVTRKATYIRGVEQDLE
jgi:antitoxin component YwqK of YwqJK toxin-antitoxin module